MRRAYLVTGPESSGTRYLNRILLAAGCARPDNQEMGGIEYSASDKIVVHRSYPWSRLWVPVGLLLGDLHNHGYRVSVLVMVRDQFVCELSQVRNGHVPDMTTARANIKRAYRELYEGIVNSSADYTLVPYQSLGNPAAVRMLLLNLGLEPPNTWEQWVDGDKKYLFPES